MCDVATDPVHIMFASAMPADLVPINPAPVTSVDAATIPIKPSPITADGCNPTAYMPVNHTHITFAHPVPAVSVPTDPNNTIPVDPMLTNYIPINSAPIDHMHIDPVAAISHISLTFIACFGHQLVR